MSASTACASEAVAREGYCVLERAVDPALIADINAGLGQRFADTPACRGDFYGPRTKRFGGLLTRSPLTARLVMHERILAIVEQMLLPWCERIALNLTQAIEIHPGALPQLPHRDQDMWQGPKGSVEYLVNVMWPLTAFTDNNGGTRLWQGSHLDQDVALLPEEEAIVPSVSPGDALIFLGSSDCSILWSARVDPSVLRVDVVPLRASNEAKSFDLRRWLSLATVVKQPSGDENLLLHDGMDSIRLDIMSGSLLDGPVALRFDIHRADSVDAKIDTLRRFLHFQRTGAIPSQRQSRERHHQRVALALRVHDALLQGASIRDVGIMLFGIVRVEAEWEASGESLKSASRRLIALARSMASGRYLKLLL